MPAEDTHGSLSLDNYALVPDSPCLGKGSCLASVAQLLTELGAEWDRRPGLDSAGIVLQRSTLGE